jgi:heterodisulfide reductase subunit A-like polyferredoxin
MPVRIGFYICHCGTNIAGKVAVEDVSRFVRGLGNVVVARDYKFMCSDPGQEMIQKDIREMGLNRVVVASCSPRLHEKTFQTACRRAGLNPYYFQMACIREHCSWVTEDPVKATQKAKSLAAAAINRVNFHKTLTAREVTVNPDILVVGAGIAGIQASLDIAMAGYQVHLVEKEPSIGGHMVQFDKTFPTLDCAACISTPKTVAVSQSPNIDLLTYSEVTEVKGFVGNFKVRVHRKPRYIREDLCTGCGLCTEECPVSVPNQFDENLGMRKAVYRHFPQAVPFTFAIDKKDPAPCRMACPAGVNVQGYVQLVGKGKYLEAVELIMERLPLPGAVGRICPQPCESACRRSEVDSAIAIRELKRFAFDQVNLEDIPLPVIEDRPERVAVIGSGPAGLSTAYYLRLKGYQVTIFEALPVLGGLLRTAIPEQKLTRDVLDREINNILRVGIPVETGKRLGTDFTLDDLRQEGFKAFFIGIGAKGTSKLNVPGIETGKRGRIAVDDSTMRTSAPDVFAAGDAVSGVASVIEAVASAHLAVQAIDSYLRGEEPAKPSTGMGETARSHGERLDASEDAKTPPKIEIDRSYLKAAKGPLAEAGPGMSEDAARAEAARCLNCSTCAECMECVRACERSAVDHSMKGEDREIQVGSIIVATGFDILDPTPLKNYGYGRLDEVYTGLEFERLNNAVGPTGGQIVMKNGKKPSSIAIIHCVGSRDINYHAYCSRVCCMYALKYGHLIKEKLGHDTSVFNFYIDMRCFGKGYEEFYWRLQEEGVTFIRGKPAAIMEENTSSGERSLVVAVEDTLLGQSMRVPVDMAILCTAVEARKNAPDVARVFGINQGGDGFFLEEHPKLGPVSTATDGIFLAGACQSPKDIPDTVSHASGAAAKALALAARGKVEVSPVASWIDPDICAGCQTCIKLCAYSAIEFNERRGVSEVNEAVCKGCGSCAAFCPSGAARVKHFTSRQVFAEIDGILDDIV